MGEAYFVFGQLRPAFFTLKKSLYTGYAGSRRERALPLSLSRGNRVQQAYTGTRVLAVVVYYFVLYSYTTVV